MCSDRCGSPGGFHPRWRPMSARKMRSTPIIRTWSVTAPQEGRPMRAFAFVSAISLALAAPADAAPRRAASLNLCTDELLLMLGEPGRIVSVTHLAQQPAET